MKRLQTIIRRLVRSCARPLLLAILLSVSAMAQNSPYLFTRQVDSLLWHVNKSGIGLMYDRVLPLANLAYFRPTDTSAAPHYEQAAAELYAAALPSGYHLLPPLPAPPLVSTDALPGYSPTALLPMPEALETLQTSVSSTSGAIPISLMLYDFSYLDTNAIRQNLLAYRPDSLLRDVVGRPRSPFLSKRLFLASPLSQSTNSTTARFVLLAHFALL